MDLQKPTLSFSSYCSSRIKGFTASQVRLVQALPVPGVSGSQPSLPQTVICIVGLDQCWERGARTLALQVGEPDLAKKNTGCTVTFRF